MFGDQKLRAREQPVPKDKSLPAKISPAFGKLKFCSFLYKIKNPDWRNLDEQKLAKNS